MCSRRHQSTPSRANCAQGCNTCNVAHQLEHGIPDATRRASRRLDRRGRARAHTECAAAGWRMQGSGRQLAPEETKNRLRSCAASAKRGHMPRRAQYKQNAPWATASVESRDALQRIAPRTCARFTHGVGPALDPDPGADITRREGSSCQPLRADQAPPRWSSAPSAAALQLRSRAPQREGAAVLNQRLRQASSASLPRCNLTYGKKCTSLLFNATLPQKSAIDHSAYAHASRAYIALPAQAPNEDQPAEPGLDAGCPAGNPSGPIDRDFPSFFKSFQDFQAGRWAARSALTANGGPPSTPTAAVGTHSLVFVHMSTRPGSRRVRSAWHTAELRAHLV